MADLDHLVGQDCDKCGRTFPGPEHGYSIPPEELERLKQLSPRRPAAVYDW